MPQTEFDSKVAQIRRFNRFYTKLIGAFQDEHLKSPFSLAEVRVMYELAHRDKPTASELSQDLGLDPGYISRILRGFRKQNLLASRRSDSDGRQTHLWLTRTGQTAFARLNKLAYEDIARMLGKLPPGSQQELVTAMRSIEELLEEAATDRPAYVLRPHQPGDMGWVTHRHGILYAQEYGWDETFEALVAEIVSDFIKNFDPKRERCWIAERDGEILGSVFLVRKNRNVAKLRLLLVEPSARGLGIGKRLVDECIRFGRLNGYKKITLWTNSVLTAARHIYKKTGFQLINEESNHAFGHDLVSETWELTL